MLEIETDVPLPGNLGRLKYPFDDMHVGDSFLITDPGMVKNARSAAWMYAKRHGQRFSCRRVEDGWRVWRVA
jgi:hypothetical protein